MTKSPREPRPVPVRRYRYSRWRWRVLVRALDLIGSAAMAGWRLFRPIRRFEPPRRVLVVQLDHMGDAVLSSPMFPRLKAAFPGATIDVLASPSNRAVFEADPHVDRVHLAARNWFERRPSGWALGSAVWDLGMRLRAGRYDLGIDVRGDVLTVLVLALAGIPRRLGWAMGGGGFLLTDVADWVPDRHEVRSRLALLERLGIAADGPARVVVHATDDDRARVGGWLRDAWPDRVARPIPRIHEPDDRVRSSPSPHAGEGRGGGAVGRPPPSIQTLPHKGGWDRMGSPRACVGDGVGREGTDRSRRFDGEARPVDRLGEWAPLLVVHLGAGVPAKRWPLRHWRWLIGRFLADGWRVVVVGGPEDLELGAALPPDEGLRDWTSRLALTETAALLERADLFLGADSGPAHLAACAGVASVVLFSGTNRAVQWRPWSRRSLVLSRPVPCRPCHVKTCPLAGHPCLGGLSPERVARAARRWWARVQGGEVPHVPA